MVEIKTLTSTHEHVNMQVCKDTNMGAYKCVCMGIFNHACAQAHTCGYQIGLCNQCLSLMMPNLKKFGMDLQFLSKNETVW